MEKHSPQLAIDGYQNIWILKPGAKSRGRGIEVKNNLQDILNTAGTSVVSQKDNKWVVQKYIGMFNPTDVSCKYTSIKLEHVSPTKTRLVGIKILLSQLKFKKNVKIWKFFSNFINFIYFLFFFYF